MYNGRECQAVDAIALLLTQHCLRLTFRPTTAVGTFRDGCRKTDACGTLKSMR